MILLNGLNNSEILIKMYFLKIDVSRILNQVLQMKRSLYLVNMINNDIK